LNRAPIFVLEDHGQSSSPIIRAPAIEYRHLGRGVSPDRFLQAHGGGRRVRPHIPKSAELSLEGEETRGARKSLEVGGRKEMSPEPPCARIDVT
jgi:hypothetical protein